MSHTIPAVLESAKALALAFSAGASAADRSGQLPLDNFKALHQAGLLSLVISKDKGGLGGGLQDAITAVSTIAQGEPATALILAMHYIQHGQIASNDGFWPPAVADALIKTSLERGALVNAAYVEPFVGSASHGALPQTKALHKGDHWLLSGHKRYVTGIAGLSWIRVLGVTDEAKQRIGHFLVPADAPGIRVEHTWDPLGMRATGSQDVIFENVRLPLEYLFADCPVDEGKIQNPLDSIWYLSLVAAVYHGVAQASRNALVRFLQEFSPGSLGAPLSSLPRFQDGLGEIEALQLASQRLLQSLGHEYDHWHDRRPEALEAHLNADASMTRLLVLRHAASVTAAVLELAGNQGLARKNDFERYHRDVLSAKAHSPNSQLLKLDVARHALGQSKKKAAASPEPQASKPALALQAGG